MAEAIFAEEYKKLNKAQKEAVEFIDGPVMVVAGPGTGKTQILALRIGNILKKLILVQVEFYVLLLQILLFMRCGIDYINT